MRTSEILEGPAFKPVGFPARHWQSRVTVTVTVTVTAPVTVTVAVWWPLAGYYRLRECRGRMLDSNISRHSVKVGQTDPGLPARHHYHQSSR